MPSNLDLANRLSPGYSSETSRSGCRKSKRNQEKQERVASQDVCSQLTQQNLRGFTRHLTQRCGECWGGHDWQTEIDKTQRQALESSGGEQHQKDEKSNWRDMRWRGGDHQTDTHTHKKETPPGEQRRRTGETAQMWELDTNIFVPPLRKTETHE
ncbi:hypothetical protein PAMP_015621 [Pampus punctatissimus]